MKQVTNAEEAHAMKAKATRTKLEVVAGWRNLAMFLWTLAAIGSAVLFDLSRPPEAPEAPEAPSSFFSPGPDFMSGLEYVPFFVGWMLGLLVVCVVALLAEAIQDRREMREILKRREQEPRRF
jgi:hypothetical protein